VEGGRCRRASDKVGRVSGGAGRVAEGGARGRGEERRAGRGAEGGARAEGGTSTEGGANERMTGRTVVQIRKTGFCKFQIIKKFVKKNQHL